MSHRASQWLARTQRRQQARIAGRLEAALDILEHTPSPRKIERYRHRATAALIGALKSLGAY